MACFTFAKKVEQEYNGDPRTYKHWNVITYKWGLTNWYVYNTSGRLASEFGVLYLNLAVPGELVSAHSFYFCIPNLFLESPKWYLSLEIMHNSKSTAALWKSDLLKADWEYSLNRSGRHFSLTLQSSHMSYISKFSCVGSENWPYLILLSDLSPCIVASCVPSLTRLHLDTEPPNGYVSRTEMFQLVRVNFFI